ncbi:MAG: AsmA family protein [Roseibium sp.]
MQRLLIGFGSLVFLLVTAILVVPFFLPKDKIKEQVVQQIDNRFGWRLRLDGPISLSLFPGFSLVADDIGLSGEAGADGIEFASAERMEFGLAWSGLISGNIQVTEIGLDEPDIYLEISPSGATSWEPRRKFGAGEREQPVDTPVSPASETAENAGSEAKNTDTASQGFLNSVGVDRLRISGGTLSYKDSKAGQDISISGLDLDLRAPDLAREVELNAGFEFQSIPLEVAGTLANPLGLVGGDEVAVSMAVSSGENTLTIAGDTGLKPLKADLSVDAAGPSLKDLAALVGQQIEADPGAFKLQTKIAGNEAAVSVYDLDLLLGKLSLGGAADANLSGLVPEVSGRLLLKDGSIADLLLLAGKDLPASGQLSADLAFASVGMTADELIAGLDLNGSVEITDGEVGGLGLASAVGGDPEADRITDLSMNVDLKGLEKPISLSGALSWRDEGFTLKGQADTAKLLAGNEAPVSVAVKGNRFGAGFDGQAALTGDLDGAVRIETADLRGLMAWMGQPLGTGGGLKTFKASGIFGAQGDTITFEETRFTLDETSGEANGRVELGGKPKIMASLALRELVLDPYLSGSSAPAPAPASAPAKATPSNGAKPAKDGTRVPGASGPKNSASKWNTAPLDFKGLQAVDVDFKLTTKEIRWDKIKIDESALSTTITNGVLTATLEKLALYDGTGAGAVTLNGSGDTPEVTAKFSLVGLNAYPLLRDTSEFEWIEGTGAINLDIKARGVSEQALVQNLNGTADYRFEDGAIRGINIPKMLRGLTAETLLGWQDNKSAKTDFSSLTSSFQIQNGIATSEDLNLVGPLVRMSGNGTTDLPNKSLAWRVEPKIVPTLEGQAPTPRRKGAEKTMAGLGVPVVIEGPWDDPRIYPDIADILTNPQAAFEQLKLTGGDLVKILNAPKLSADDFLGAASEVLETATGGRTQIDVQKVIDGDVDDEQVLKAVEEGFGLPPGLLGNVLTGGKKKKN